jgi:hypothetical protein
MDQAELMIAELAEACRLQDHPGRRGHEGNVAVTKPDGRIAAFGERLRRPKLGGEV